MKADDTLYCGVTFHRDVAASKAPDHVFKKYLFREFISKLKICAAAPHREKDKNDLFTNAQFDPSMSEQGYRDPANFVASWFAFLDFDGGKLSPDDFVRISYLDAGRGQQQSFIIWNHFNRTPDNPNKFTAMVFYRRPARSMKEQNAVFAHLIQRMRDAGFAEADAKLHPQSRSGVQSLPLPCTNVLHPEMAFFSCFNTHSADIRRYGIAPDEILKTGPQSNPPRPADFRERDVSDDEIEKLVAPVRAMKEGRHASLYILTWKLRRKGVPEERCLRALLSISDEPHIQVKARFNVKQLYGMR